MFHYDFPPGLIDTFRHGSFPKACRISHTYNNPNWHYSLHVHEDQIELLYIAGGEAEIVLDQQTYQVTAGDILLVDTGIDHSITSNPDNPSDIWCLSAINVEFCDQPAGRLVSAHTNAGENRAFIEQTMRQIRDFTDRMDTPVQAACNHLCAALIVLFRQLLLQASAVYAVKSKTLASDILAYLNANYDKHIDLEQLSRISYTSASHISREFKRKYNISPINYLIDKRLSEAKWLLINTDEPIQWVAEQVGYQNGYHFTKLFADRNGCSPGDYRQQYGNVRADAMPGG